MAFKFLGQRQLGKLPSRWVSTILMVAIAVLLRRVLAVYKVPPADFDSLRGGERPYGPTSQSPAGDSSPFRGATA